MGCDQSKQDLANLKLEMEDHTKIVHSNTEQTKIIMKQVQEMKLDVKVSMQRIHEDVLKEISPAGDSRNQESKAVKDIGQHMTECSREISSIKSRVSFLATEVHKLQSELDAGLVQMAKNGSTPTQQPPLSDHTQQGYGEETKAVEAKEYGLFELSSAIVDVFQPLNSLFVPTRLFGDDHATSKLNPSGSSGGLPQFEVQSGILPEVGKLQTDSKRPQESAFPGEVRPDTDDGGNPSSSSKSTVSPLLDQDNVPDSSTMPKSNKELAEERRAQLRARRAATESQTSA